MIIATIAGNVVRDAELRQAGKGQVCSFSVASNRKTKGESVATFVDVSIWGKRGDALQPFITKGSKIVVSGELSTREHNGKTYLQVNADQVELMGGSKSGGGGTKQAVPFEDTGEGGDDIPFALNVTDEVGERWWRI